MDAALSRKVAQIIQSPYIKYQKYTMEALTEEQPDVTIENAAKKAGTLAKLPQEIKDIFAKAEKSLKLSEGRTNLPLAELKSIYEQIEGNNAA